MAVGSGSSGEIILVKDRINKALGQSWNAFKSTERQQPYLVKEITVSNRAEVFISFQGCGSVKEWYSGTPFGDSKINQKNFPSLKSVGNDEFAQVNKAFQLRFEAVLDDKFKTEVEKAMTKQKQIVFTGYSSGGAVASLAALWALDKYLTPKAIHIPPLCVTFGSPLVGNRIFSHATRREKWSEYFTHFVTQYDILPRLLLAPLSSFEDRFDPVLEFFNRRSRSFMDQSVGRNPVTTDLFFAVMKNAANATSHAACKLMSNTNTISETLASFIDLSPYRPFGTYIFCTRSRKLTGIRNPEAVLQLLFFSAQLDNEDEAAQVADRCLTEHPTYAEALREGLRPSVPTLGELEKLPLSADGSDVDTALNDLGLSKRARLCLRAAGESDKQKIRNEQNIDVKKAEASMKKLEDYKAINETQKVSYYDAFKLQNHQHDFKSNVSRLELASVWDEIIEKLRNYELPDEFEGKEEWIKLGTKFRRLVEPLDVANYYRHVRNDTTGPYLEGRGRPRRYRFPQRWLEHSERKPAGTYSESSVLARVEELCIKTQKHTLFENMREDILKLEGDISRWNDENILSKDVLLEGSTLVKWWNNLPLQHKEGSCIRNLIPEKKD